jgi:hypothetical protein
MLCISGSWFVVMYGVDVFFVSYSKAPAGLTDVLYITALASHFINAAVIRSANTEKKLIKNLQDKLEQNNLILTKADKGNTVITVQKDVYYKKINDFISQHKFTKVRNNYTNVQQKAIKTVINARKLTMGRHEKWKYINMNPKSPYIFGNIKLHKADQPIRPTVNWRNSPGYKLAVHVSKILKQKIRLPNTFNVQNSKMLMNDLKQLEVHLNIKACSFDIKNMYTSIPIDKLTNIIHRLLKHNNIPDEHIHEIITLTKVILDQNYFQYNNELYSQKEGLAMGAPTSSILAETYIQYLEHTSIIQILQNHHIIDYYRYVDDILIIYDETLTNIHDTLDKFNSIDHNIQYTVETQTEEKLNYLDIIIINSNNAFTFDIYRKRNNRHNYPK